MSQLFAAVLLVLLGAFFGFGAGGVMFVGDPLNECRKQHNVYRCEMVAVPILTDTGEGK